MGSCPERGAPRPVPAAFSSLLPCSTARPGPVVPLSYRNALLAVKALAHEAQPCDIRDGKQTDEGPRGHLCRAVGPEARAPSPRAQRADRASQGLTTAARLLRGHLRADVFSTRWPPYSSRPRGSASHGNQRPARFAFQGLDKYTALPSSPLAPKSTNVTGSPGGRADLTESAACRVPSRAGVTFSTLRLADTLCQEHPAEAGQL